MLIDVETNIRYRSTRSSREVDIETAIAEGLSPDGGLYVPTHFPSLPERVFDPAPLEYAELALLVLEPFFPGWEDGSLKRILDRAYADPDNPRFYDPAVAPVGRLDEDTAIIELFHGRTCAFKDMALSAMGGLLRESLDRLGLREPVLMLTATSGDTGSAALEGFSRVPGVRTAVFYPESGTSEIQRLQMVSAPKGECFVAALRGNFDDAQRTVKSVFARAAAGKGPLAGVRLSSANSINIGRLLPQIVYYVKAWRDLSVGGSLDVAVPTGNFGDILAARYAKSMGLPLGRLICASNANRVLADFFATGIYDRRRPLVKTESPSMDILVSSNLERLLFTACGEDPVRISALMENLARDGRFELAASERECLADFSAGWADDSRAAEEIGRLWEDTGVLVDPHTAVALCVLEKLRESGELSGPTLVAATASPFKFPVPCARAIGFGRERASDSCQGGDLELAQALASATGIELPEPIRALSGLSIQHRLVLDTDDVESALAAFRYGGAV